MNIDIALLMVGSFLAGVCAAIALFRVLDRGSPAQQELRATLFGRKPCKPPGTNDGGGGGPKEPDAHPPY